MKVRNLPGVIADSYSMNKNLLKGHPLYTVTLRASAPARTPKAAVTMKPVEAFMVAKDEVLYASVNENAERKLPTLTPFIERVGAAILLKKLVPSCFLPRTTWKDCTKTEKIGNVPERQACAYFLLFNTN